MGAGLAAVEDGIGQWVPVLADKQRLQTELDLLKSQDTTQAYFQKYVAPLQAQINNLTYQLTGKAATQTANNG